MKIVIIDPAYNHGRWQINLTDGQRAWGRRHYTDGDQALAHVQRLLRAGYRPAFMSALADLVEAATMAEPATAA